MPNEKIRSFLTKSRFEEFNAYRVDVQFLIIGNPKIMVLVDNNSGTHCLLDEDNKIIKSYLESECVPYKKALEFFQASMIDDMKNYDGTKEAWIDTFRYRTAWVGLRKEYNKIDDRIQNHLWFDIYRHYANWNVKSSILDIFNRPIYDYTKHIDTYNLYHIRVGNKEIDTTNMSTREKMVLLYILMFLTDQTQINHPTKEFTSEQIATTAQEKFALRSIPDQNIIEKLIYYFSKCGILKYIGDGVYSVY